MTGKFTRLRRRTDGGAPGTRAARAAAAGTVPSGTAPDTARERVPQ
ncbi:hypothetical protein HUT13_20415 [Streptomyces harbinensis]|nr:hypothetical protein [Streptomyces harbinensis]QKV70862.1 hypothetical protein HUT13_20415 [Streptomyces harbinensis]